jgi:RNA polymerase sigma-70 factor (ECF subfamily)
MSSPSSVEQLVANHRKFREFVASRVANPSDAEEILQAAYVRGVEKAEGIRDDESVVAWFYRLLRNAIIDHYRHRDAERRALERSAAWMSDASVLTPDFADAICQCVETLLPTINADYADLIRGVDLEQRSIAEMADSLGMTPNHTRVKLHRARKALRKQLEVSCRTCAEHACLDCDCRSKS